MWSGASNPWSGGGSRLAESVVGRQLLSGEGGKSGRTSCDCGFTSPDGRPCGDSNTGVTSGGSPWSFNEGTGLCESAVTCSRPCSNCYAAGGSRDLLDPEGAWGGRGDWGQAELRMVCRRAGAYDNADCLKVKCVHSEGGCLCYVQCCNTKDSGEGCALCEMVLIDGGTFPTCPAEEIDSAPGVVSESPCWSKSLADAIEAAKENWAEIQADLERAQAVYDALAEETSEWVNSWGIDWEEGDGLIAGTRASCTYGECMAGADTRGASKWLATCKRCLPWPETGDPEASEKKALYRSCEGLAHATYSASLVREREHLCYEMTLG